MLRGNSGDTIAIDNMEENLNEENSENLQELVHVVELINGT